MCPGAVCGAKSSGRGSDRVMVSSEEDKQHTDKQNGKDYEHDPAESNDEELELSILENKRHSLKPRKRRRQKRGPKK